ncbi:MAG: hypothetical protein OXF68_13150 [Gammaproteobacteria bacterium]|nr:hypothetical protein [Gammaproteobacteria bacterium]
MSLNAKVLYDMPQQEIASLLCGRIDRCTSASLVVGFMTLAGINAISEPLHKNPSKLRTLVIGAGNHKAFEACDQLFGAGVNPDNIYVHLGSTRRKNKDPGFVPYHPMLHSKIYLMEMGNGDASALIGSHNLTSFAMQGLNGEASMLLEGPSSHKVFDDIRMHIAEAVRQSVVYDTSKKEGYAWWAAQYIKGLGAQFKDQPRDAENQRTMVVMAEYTSQRIPRTDDIVYFEIPKAIEPVEHLRTEVHVFLFSKLPHTPARGLSDLARAEYAFKCQTMGIEDDRGGLELRADWQILDRAKPILCQTPDPFRPSPGYGKQQIRVKVNEEAPMSFEYLFDTGRVTWRPSLDKEPQGTKSNINMDEQAVAQTRSQEEWYPVKDLVPEIRKGISATERSALKEMSPQSGNYFLISLRRRRK